MKKNIVKNVMIKVMNVCLLLTIKFIGGAFQPMPFKVGNALAGAKNLPMAPRPFTPMKPFTPMGPPRPFTPFTPLAQGMPQAAPFGLQKPAVFGGMPVQNNPANNNPALKPYAAERV